MRPSVAVQLAATAALLPRLARGRRRAAPLAPRPVAGASVSVVVPARDEEERLAPCLAGIAADGGALETIVVDDHSTDRTAAVAQAAGARVVECPPRPRDWTGKPWALQTGVEAARGDVVVCLDADARPEPGLLGALAELAAERTVVSVQPRFTCAGPVDTALHASFAATLVYRYGPLDVADRQPPARRVLLNGQCVCARRADLLTAGGWAPIRANVTEDIALGRALRSAGWRVVVRDATSLLAVAGYSSVTDTWEGWGRSLMARDVEHPLAQAADLALLWLCWALPLPRVVGGRAGALDAALVLLRVALLGALRRSYAPRGLGFWLSPLADVPAALRLTESVVRPRRSWRGRRYAGRRARPRTS